MYYKNMKKNRAAFTLVETIIAISVIGLVVTAAFQLTQSSLKIGANTMQKLTAFHLAEEGLEITRNMRDSNWIANLTWDQGLCAGKYIIEEKQNYASGGNKWNLIPVADDDSAPEIKLKENQRFKRIIEIETLSSQTDTISAINITSKVFYFEGVKKNEIALAMELTDWKKGPL